MSEHSIAETRNQLTKLIARAEKGEVISITRHGKKVAELRASPAAGKPITQADIDWLATRRVGKRGKLNAGQLVSAMRDEDWR